MSKIPDDTKKTKYNQNDPFRWIDSQWEKFMTEQKELKAHIKQLQDDLVTCNKHFQEQKKNMEELVARVPSVYLTGTVGLGNYIYESPDGGKTVYRREVGDYDNKEQVDNNGNPLPQQMELFPFKA